MKNNQQKNGQGIESSKEKKIQIDLNILQVVSFIHKNINENKDFPSIRLAFYGKVITISVRISDTTLINLWEGNRSTSFKDNEAWLSKISKYILLELEIQFPKM